MNIFVFGSSLTSTFWNGAATYYRGIYKNLNRLGYHITFAEPAIYDRQEHKDAGEIGYADIRVYKSATEIPELLAEAARNSIVIKHSGVGAEDARLERDVLNCRSQTTRVMFWDVDAPATLARVEVDSTDPLRALISQYDAVLTYGGGVAVVEHYVRLGAKICVPIYNALDPETHFRVPADPSLKCDLAFIGHRLPDREWRVEEFLLRAAILAPEMSFVLGGEGWADKKLPANVRWIGHVPSGRHNAVNCSARMVLNVNRDSMAKVGFSPPTRVFEAAGAGACLITDKWEGVDHFFAPDKEILIAKSATDVAQCLRQYDAEKAVRIGRAMQRRALRDHSYASRAVEVDGIFRRILPKLQSVQTRHSPGGVSIPISSTARRAS